MEFIQGRLRNLENKHKSQLDKAERRKWYIEEVIPFIKIGQ